MLRLVNTWYHKHFNDPQVAILAIFLISSAAVLYLFGNILVPLLAALIIAYLLDGVVAKCVNIKMPRFMAIMLTFTLFIISKPSNIT